MAHDPNALLLRRDYGSIVVSVFRNVMTNGNKDLGLRERGGLYKKDFCDVWEMTLREFLELGIQYEALILKYRSSTDPQERELIKKTKIPVGVLSARIRHRIKEIPMDDKLIEYNSLIVLDFDHLQNVEAVKELLKSVPYIWYVGKSIGGQGLFAIVPIAATSWKQHDTYFRALVKEMKAIGLEVDEKCGDVLRSRVASIDKDPYFNDECEVFTLDLNEEDETQQQEDDDFEPFEVKTPEISGEERVRLYVEEWEQKKIPLDDYGDWLTIGMALSSIGDNGRAAFHRVSRFSKKYRPEDTDKAFDSYVRDTRSIGLGSFFYKCHAMGVIPESIPHYECIPFPTEVFPKMVREIIDATHLHQNFPVDYIGPSLFFVACLACGNSAVVELREGWYEKPLLYLAIVGGRGTNKTSSFEFALAPIRRRDDLQYEKYVEAKEKYDIEAAKPAKERKKLLEPPAYEQYILSDFTPEVLVRQHKASPRGLIVFNDELIGFILSFNKYRSGSDEQMWTQLFTGGGVIVNRVGSDPVKINDTCIGIFGGIQPEILHTFARGKIQNGFVDRWLFAFPEKVPYPKFDDVDIDKKIARNWGKIIDKILKLPFDGTPNVVKLSPGAKRLYKEWYNRLSEQKNHSGSAFAGLATKMDRYCARFALGLEALKYGCSESEMKTVSEESMRGAIALSYYFIACGLKAQKRFLTSPVDELDVRQREIYDALPASFDTGQGLEIAQRLGMRERTFKRWIQTNLFKRISHGFYEKRYR